MHAGFTQPSIVHQAVTPFPLLTVNVFSQYNSATLISKPSSSCLNYQHFLRGPQSIFGHGQPTSFPDEAPVFRSVKVFQVNV